MNLHATLKAAIACHGRAAVVTVGPTQGSVPRDTGAWMIVTAEGYHGTIGGGALEWQAIADAQDMLRDAPSCKVTRHLLGPDLGQCCGGRVELMTEVFDVASQLPDSERTGDRHILLFGAGHVGRAVVLALASLPFQVTWVDSRAMAFPGFAPQNCDAVHLDDPVAALKTVQPGSLVFVMTHSHALDLDIVDAALRHINVSHVGLIGSATKRARFVKRLTEAGVRQTELGKLVCPIGVAGIGGKEPAIIAASTVAQILILSEALFGEQSIEHRHSLSA